MYESVVKALTDAGKIDGSRTQFFVYLLKGAHQMLEDNRKQLALLTAQRRFEEAKANRDAVLRELGVDPASLEETGGKPLPPSTTTKEVPHGA